MIDSIKKDERYAYSQEQKFVPNQAHVQEKEESEDEEDEVDEDDEEGDQDSEEDELEASRMAVKGGSSTNAAAKKSKKPKKKQQESEQQTFKKIRFADEPETGMAEIKETP